MGERDSRDQIDQLAQFGLIDLQTGIEFIEYTFEIRVIDLDGV